MPKRRGRPVALKEAENEAIRTFMDVLEHPEKYPRNGHASFNLPSPPMTRARSRTDALESENARLRSEVEILRAHPIHIVHRPIFYREENVTVEEFERVYKEDEPVPQPKGRKIVLDT